MVPLNARLGRPPVRLAGELAQRFGGLENLTIPGDPTTAWRTSSGGSLKSQSPSASSFSTMLALAEGTIIPNQPAWSVDGAHENRGVVHASDTTPELQGGDHIWVALWCAGGDPRIWLVDNTTGRLQAVVFHLEDNDTFTFESNPGPPLLFEPKWNIVNLGAGIFRVSAKFTVPLGSVLPAGWYSAISANEYGADIVQMATPVVAINSFEPTAWVAP